MLYSKSPPLAEDETAEENPPRKFVRDEEARPEPQFGRRHVHASMHALPPKPRPSTAPRATSPPTSPRPLANTPRASAQGYARGGALTTAPGISMFGPPPPKNLVGKSLEELLHLGVGQHRPR